MTIEKTDIKTFEYKGFKVHVIYCRHCCGQKPENKRVWQWAITQGGSGESEAEVMSAAEKWINEKLQG